MLLFHNAEQVVQVVAHGEPSLIGPNISNKIAIINNGSLLINPETGNITCVGTNDEVQQYITLNHIPIKEKINCTNKVILPGFIDAHTHPVWDGDRSHEFALKLNGASYMEIEKAGGGINFTTQHTREASESKLLELLTTRLNRMLSFGTTTIEAKSGYGLEVETELKMLRVLHKANNNGPITIISTFCGAHAIPPGVSAEEATNNVIHIQLPAVLKEKKENLNDVSNIDVFCETGVFNIAQTREICKAGKAHGLHINFHGDELSYLGAGELAGELHATAVSHLEYISTEGILQMRRVNAIAVLLPVTAFTLRLPPPPAREIISGNVAVALGTDFCPNAHSLSLPHAMLLASVTLRMTPQEALAGVTINAAASLHISHHCGSLEAGKWGDFVILSAPRWEHVIYQMIDPPIAAVYKRGKLVYARGK